VTAGVAQTAGAGLRALVAVARALRRSPRPLHPRGVVRHGTLVLDGPDAPGARELGAPLVTPALARVSRSVGLPAPLPDVFGVAVRWPAARPDDGPPQDLLLSSTGLGRVSRFLLAPRRHPLGGGFGTLMPFLDAGGRPVLLAAVPAPGAGPSADDGIDLILLTARPGGPWQRCGRLVCRAGPDDADDPALRFDPMLHAPGTLRVPRWAAQLRVPSYREARAGEAPEGRTAHGAPAGSVLR
jgi:hypothetical protein